MNNLVMQMQERTLGRTQLRTKILGVGGICPQEVLEKALAYGLTFFDVHRYKDPAGVDNRIRFKNAFNKSSRKRSELILTDRSDALTRGKLLEDLDETLRMLEVDYLDIYGLYNITQNTDRMRTAMGPGGAIEGLREAKASGKIRFIGGVSGHHHKELVKLLRTDVFDAVMVSVNIFDQDVIEAVLPVAKELGIGTIVMKPFAKGLFTESPEAALKYVFSQDISVAIPGMITVVELEQNIRTASGFRGMSDPDRAALKKETDEITRTLGKHFCRQCGYCVPVCPQEIDIKNIFYMERQANRYYSVDWARKEYAGIANNASTCVECGNCEAECPYDLPIREMLKDTHKSLS